MSFLDSPINPPFLIEGLDALKKKKDPARRQKYSHAGAVQIYTAQKGQYSQ
jgi:hypothetical protein